MQIGFNTGELIKCQLSVSVQVSSGIALVLLEAVVSCSVCVTVLWYAYSCDTEQYAIPAVVGLVFDFEDGANRDFLTNRAA